MLNNVSILLRFWLPGDNFNVTSQLFQDFIKTALRLLQDLFKISLRLLQQYFKDFFTLQQLLGLYYPTLLISSNLIQIGLSN